MTVAALLTAGTLGALPAEVRTMDGSRRTLKGRLIELEQLILCSQCGV